MWSSKGRVSDHSAVGHRPVNTRYREDRRIDQQMNSMSECQRQSIYEAMVVMTLRADNISAIPFAGVGRQIR
jgi:hypothetical protein